MVPPSFHPIFVWGIRNPSGTARHLLADTHSARSNAGGDAGGTGSFVGRTAAGSVPAHGYRDGMLSAIFRAPSRLLGKYVRWARVSSAKRDALLATGIRIECKERPAEAGVWCLGLVPLMAKRPRAG
jgi:hypothetical protein